MSSMRVGFVGLGNMGWPMARRCVDAGFSVTGFDMNPDMRARFSATATVARAADLGPVCDVVVTMLPTGQIVRDVLLGHEGLAETMAPGSIVVDMSSSDPVGTVELGAALLQRGITLIDAPVSGGTGGAEAGTLAVMVGCDDNAIMARCQPLLQAMGARVFHAGRLGSGHATKAINNVIAAGIISLTAEGLVIGQRFGLDPSTLLDIINNSTGRSFSSEGLFTSQILTRKFAQGFALALMAKDAGLGAGLARAVGSSTPFVELTAQTWAAARDALPGADFSEMYRYVEMANGLNRPT